MPKSKVTIKGDAEIMAKLEKNKSKIMLAGVTAVNVSCDLLKQSMKKYCPTNKDPKKDPNTYRLKESIKVLMPAKRYKYKVIGKVGPEKDTTIHVEFGTSTAKAQPFMRIQPYLLQAKVRKVCSDMIKGALGL